MHQLKKLYKYISNSFMGYKGKSFSWKKKSNSIFILCVKETMPEFILYIHICFEKVK